MSGFRPIWILPCYRHGEALAKRLPALCATGVPVLVVDDGNEPPLDFAPVPGGDVRIVRRERNGGKGAALLTGARAALKAGFSHALQLDADGQHNLEDARGLIAAAAAEPETLHSGYPLYGPEVPKARLKGRELTRWMIRLETGLRHEDAQCGCRAYPLAKLLEVAKHIRGRRMDFDIEVIVRWAWAGERIKPFPVHVAYVPGGVSNFRMVRDNAAFAWLHTRLLTQRICRLLFQRRAR
ncbi:MAG: glycosyltransferase family 2 protein [Candidatus Spyradenecus sp.]